MRPDRSCGGPGQRSQTTPPSGGTQRNRSSASSIRSHSTQRSTSGRTPSSSRRCISYQRATRPGAMPASSSSYARRRRAYSGSAAWRSSRLRSASSARYQAVAVLSRSSRRLSQAWPDADLGDHVEGPSTGERHGQLRERLQAAAQARGRPTDALGDGLELAPGRGDEGQDTVGLAQVEAGQHDGFGGVATGRGHRLATVAPQGGCRGDGRGAGRGDPRGAGPPHPVIRSVARGVSTGRRRCGCVPRTGVVPTRAWVTRVRWDRSIRAIARLKRRRAPTIRAAPRTNRRQGPRTAGRSAGRSADPSGGSAPAPR